MRFSWAVVGMVVACAGCALDELESGGGDDGDAVAARKTVPACKTKKHDKTKVNGKEKNCSTTTQIGPTGGVVEHPGGATLTIPAGAVDGDVAISVVDEGAPGPDGTQMFSPVFTFEPDGTLFARP